MTVQAPRQADWYKRAKADPAFLARRASRERARRLALKASPACAAVELAKALERQRMRRGTASRAAPFAGSVLAAAAPSPGRTMLEQITALAPRVDDREDVIGEALVLALEGMPLGQAVKAAARRVRQGGQLRYMARLEACLDL